jgi:hypothetical protein
MDLARPDLLAAALETIDEAFAIFDADDRLVTFNARFATLASAAGGAIVPGLSWETMIGESVRSGSIPEAVGREESWLAQRRRARGAYSTIRRLPHGRSFQINERRMLCGGIVVVWTDVTGLLEKTENRSCPTRTAAGTADGVSYDPHDLMAEAMRWREIATQAPPVRREVYLSRAMKCETMAVRSVGMPALAE